MVHRLLAGGHLPWDFMADSMANERGISPTRKGTMGISWDTMGICLDKFHHAHGVVTGMMGLGLWESSPNSRTVQALNIIYCFSLFPR